MVKKGKKKVLEPGQHRKGPDMDGFSTIEEQECMSIKEENIAPYSMPAEAFDFKPTEEAIICKFKNGDQERKIYCNIKLQDAEQKQLEDLQEHAKGSYFLPSITIMAGRFLSRARGSAKKAIDLMQSTQEWRLEYFAAGPVMDKDVAEDLKHGVVYFAGRDSSLRPVIVCRAARIPAAWYKEKSADRLIKILVFCMEYMIRYMMVPGLIENNCLLVDLKGLGISQVPFTALSQIYSVMSHHYIGRVFKFYICNMSTTLRTITGMVTSLLTDRQKQKLVIIDDVKLLQKEFALHQLEEDLGGTRPLEKDFFPFPMQPGPFTAGYAGGPDLKAAKNGHRVLSTLGSRGQLYTTAKSEEENQELEYSEEAMNFFTSNGLKVPAACVRQQERRQKQQEELEERERLKKTAAGATLANTTKEQDGNHDAVAAAPLCEEEGNQPEEETEEEVIIQDSAVKPKGWFCCKCSH